MIAPLPSRGIGAAVLAVGLVLAGCSSDSDVPEVAVSAPDGGTQINTDTGSGGDFPDINTVPNQRPTSTFQDLAQAPEGLPAAQSGTQYGEALVGGPTSTAAPPAPPPPPEPPQQALAPIPEPGIRTEQSGDAPSVNPYVAPPETQVAPVGSSEPIATPEIVEPQPMEPIAEPAPAPSAPQGQTIEGTTAQPVTPEAAPQPEPVAAEPEPSVPASPPPPSSETVQQAQVPSVPNTGAASPEAYGIAPPGSAQPAYQAYATTPPKPGAPVAPPASPAAAPGFPGYGQTSYTGQPVGLIYFRDGSSDLSSDDQGVLRQIADIQRTYGAVVNVIGHASMDAESAEYTDQQEANQRISEARANAVGLQLMRYGVPESAIRVSAVGASQPLYSEATTNGEAANRRVEIYLSAY